VLALAALAVAMIAVERGRAITVMGEVIPANEGAYTAEIIASAIESVNYPAAKDRPAPHPPYRRDVHAKAHGCVQALVDVAKDLAPAFRQGVFAQPGHQYRAWIRFSSGNTWPQPDSERDARGFALKLTGVPGPKLLEPEETADTQDFVLINSPVFFIRNVEDYAKFTRTLADGSRFVDALRIPQIAPSLGGVESLVEQPSLMSFFELSPEQRAALGIKDNLVRYSVGIEDAADLIADLRQALDVL
jgi:hypothetical protein